MADLFLQSLRRRKEISITVHGRRTGRKIGLPVWFALDDGTLCRSDVTRYYTDFNAAVMIAL